ncbi:beta-N-acetylhexosaminidase [Arachidicoccus terrestris]|uniref:beta-N-acetylhexosaminidase n=1 Tax=Arachidicoccus terrestris TaxID=2875539 RepID=UPI001CC60A20|nr:family 20 glycosylhydrolase [Arachidicoccus terrestris]UAY55585.1 family 20 glycosylhydrolase [Arachidicoccus terrestris]
MHASSYHLRRLATVSFCILLITQPVLAQTLMTPNYDLIPKPVSLKKSQGNFEIDSTIRIDAPEDWTPTVALLKEKWHLPVKKSPKTPTTAQDRKQITLHKVSDALLFTNIIKSDSYINKNTLKNHIKEAYLLQVDSNTISITASGKEGGIHGLFTLLQLEQLQWNRGKIPAVSIADFPRFTYRGLMLDVSRNFFPPAYIKKLIDVMALYKFNNFHWHLTDGAGWRLEIKKYPLLTSKAAFRPQGPQTAWSKAGRKYAAEGAPGSYGGYYSQAEARDIVRYAAIRGINIIPEIEFPGHAEEVLAAYPFLSATGSAAGVHELNVCSDSTYTFMENVLTEVMDIFPSSFIHIGGDEASKKSWKECEACKVLMKENNITSLEGLQSYGIRRLEKFLSSLHRQLLGWDEITEGGLAPGAAVMVWRNPHTGIEVARKGHYAIMSPGKYLYLDHYQSDPRTEPETIGGYIPLSKVYHFNPLPADSLNKKQTPYLLGVQANLFTEWVPSQEHADYMLFPRALALAEVGWTSYERQDFSDFQRRMQQQYLLLQRASVNYCRPRPVVLHEEKVDQTNDQIRITLSSELYNPSIYYSTNGSNPLANGKLYQDPFYVKGHTLVKAVVKNPDYDSIRIDSFTVDYHHAIGKKVTYNLPYSNRYKAAGAATLTDGITGTLTYSDDRWQGFLGKQMDVTIDMGMATDLKSLDIRYMQLIGPGVYMPRYVEVKLSDDNKNFISEGTVKTTTAVTEKRLGFENYHFDLSGRKARYIRVIAPNYKGFLFTDEIKIY